MTDLEFIMNRKLVAIARGVEPDQIEKIADALIAGGIQCMEVTFDHTSEGGIERTLRCISILSEKYQGRILVGAGTVLYAEEVVKAIAAGARYIISPDVNPEVIRMTKKLGAVSIPGAMTPTEAQAAVTAGADLVKLFPAANLGPAYLKAISSPLKGIKFVPTGGVTPENIPSFLAVGAAGFGIGGNLINLKKVQAGDFAAITESAKEFVKALEA